MNLKNLEIEIFFQVIESLIKMIFFHIKKMHFVECQYQEKSKDVKK